jgi:hypothetical protein
MLRRTTKPSLADAPLTGVPVADIVSLMATDSARLRRLLLAVLALAAVIGALLVVSILVDPSAGAAGGCGGG